MHFTGSKVSLLLAGRCVLGCWAVRCSVACDVWSGMACAGLGRCVGVGAGRAGRLGRVHLALRLPALF